MRVASTLGLELLASGLLLTWVWGIASAGNRRISPELRPSMKWFRRGALLYLLCLAIGEFSCPACGYAASGPPGPFKAS